ncbi:MAG: hypothetical protein MUF07_10870 [Steroidobacteraceae bacterium]|nr:hypothetical protein [Steroidobacteraceae bacterium]
MPHQEGPQAELGGEALRQFVLRMHRLLEVVEAMVAHEEHVRQVEEPAEAEVGGAVFEARPERIEQQPDGLRIVLR